MTPLTRPPSPVRRHLEDPDIRTPAFEAIRGLIERVTVLDDPAGVALDLEGAITAMIDLAQPLVRDVDRNLVKVVAGVGFEPTTFRL
jgi:site-specific DNA recombinase